MKTLKIYSLNSFHLWHTAILIIFIKFYITSLVPRLEVYTFWLSSSNPPPPPAYGSHKTDLFFYEFLLFLFLSIIDLQHYASSWHTP